MIHVKELTLPAALLLLKFKSQMLPKNIFLCVCFTYHHIFFITQLQSHKVSFVRADVFVCY